jgi:NCAIR mutase (PurE)-related protein
MDSDALRHLLEKVAKGDVSPSKAAETLQFAPFEAVGDFAHIDNQRSIRNGFPEVVWGQGKPPAQMVRILQHLHANGGLAMATRVEPDAFAYIHQHLPQAEYAAAARICYLRSVELPHYPGQIAVISAGTTDLPVAEEAALTGELCGFEVERLWDVGVAGIHRLLHHREAIAQAHVIIVVAGMEGALASVVGGLADCPVIAVPTSVGYGASFGGLAALLAMLNSCAAGVGVLNIDNGFGAAILACQILKTAARLARKPELQVNFY